MLTVGNSQAVVEELLGMGRPAFSGQLIDANSCCELPVQVLVEDFLRSPVPQCRVKTSPIIPEFDVAGNILLGFFPCRVGCPVNALDFERGIEGFCQAIVVAYPGAAHRLADPQPFQDGGELTRRVIAAAI